MNTKKIGTIIAIAALSVMILLPAYAQGPERFLGTPLPGVFPRTIPGGANGPAAWDNNRDMDILVGVIIGGMLIQMIENTRYEDQNRHYSDPYRDGNRDRDRDYDRDWRRDHDGDQRNDGAWNNRNNRDNWGYNDRPRPEYRPHGW